MKSVGLLLPRHECLRRALQWLAAQAAWDAKIIEEASCRFNLSPIDEEFLLQHVRDAMRDTQDPHRMAVVRARSPATIGPWRPELRGASTGMLPVEWTRMTSAR